MKNVTDKAADIYFYGEIVGDEWDKWTNMDTCPKDVIDALKEADGRDIDVYINSPGGLVFAGVAIYNMLKRHSGKKTVHIDGVAASIASVIAMAGDTIIMPKNAYLMIHKPLNITIGNAVELRKMADDLDVIQSGIEEAYKTKLLSTEYETAVHDMMEAETWLTASDAAKYFDVVVGEENTMAAKVDRRALQNYLHVPEVLISEEKEEETLKNELQAKLDLLGLQLF